MYIRIAFLIELRLRVSRSLRSLANNSRICGYPEAKPTENRKPETRELCRAPSLHTRYSLSNLYHPGMRGFERVATCGNKKCGLCPYLIHTFGPIGCIKSGVRWYKYIYIYIYIYICISYRPFSRSIVDI